MSMTRSGEVVSSQIGKMGVISGLESKNFTLANGQCFNVKNDGDEPVLLSVQLAGAEEGEFVETYFEVGWNPEIIAAIKQTGITTNNLKWGF